MNFDSNAKDREGVKSHDMQFSDMKPEIIIISESFAKEES